MHLPVRVPRRARPVATRNSGRPRTFQDSPTLVKYGQVSVTDGDSAKGYRSASAHQIIDAVTILAPEEYGAIHAEDLVKFCREYYNRLDGGLADTAG